MLEALDGSKREIFSYFQRYFDSDAVSQAVTLKIQNLLLAKYHYLARDATIISRPFGLVVDPSNFCNLKCPGCVHSPTAKSSFNWQMGTLSAHDFAAYMDRYGPYATHITMCSWGEPLLNQDTPVFLRLAKRYLMRTMLSTNLSIGRLDADAYVNSGLDFMVLSIDGATQPVYQQYRRNGNLDLVYQNIRNLVAARKQLGKRTPILNWQFLVFEHNQHEIPLAIRTAKELGVDMITICPPDDVSWDVPAIHAADINASTEIFNQECSTAIRVNWNCFPEEIGRDAIQREFDARWGDQFTTENAFKPAPTSHTCRWLYTNMIMDANLQIAPCCGSPLKTYDLNFGRFDAQSVTEVFNSEKYRYSREYFAGQVQTQMPGAPHCVDCDWNKETPNIGPSHVDQYLFDVPGIDSASRALLN